VSIEQIGERVVYCPFEPRHHRIVLRYGIDTYQCYLLRAEDDTREDWAIELQVDKGASSSWSRNSESQGKSRLTDVSGQALLVVSFTGKGLGGFCLQFFEIVGTELGQIMQLRVGPQILDGVEFRGIGWGEFDVQAGYAVHVFPHVGRTMRLQTIPQNDNGATKVPPHLLQHRYHDRFLDRDVRLQQMVAAKPSPGRRNRHHANRRNVMAALGVVLQHRRLAPRGPSSLDDRQHQKAAFVPEYDHRAKPARFFSMRGQSRATQRAISFSFRSRARRTGRWREKSNVFSKSGT